MQTNTTFVRTQQYILFGVGTNINKFSDSVYVRVIVNESSVNIYFRRSPIDALKLKIAGKVLKLPAIAGSQRLFRTLLSLFILNLACVSSHFYDKILAYCLWEQMK
jgi:hypothetical protein